ncbi:hypothetical protein SPBR_06398 [Sporothrix brasiliensis 5110]|uniref:methionyl-tRNA formyltransferase n=1 Tax=Sporothrix brasiliensis 5110 TaxID=1398154 RepID=A0A0C2IQU6_9PEZI|nr:uncharacterized protein SPBR_06398 [Sporothrix brasiliensis 5110]KIH89260.1 hypothetical protein SPBR_06398 [Sporothrix brasiliensis 5110]
MPLPQPPAASQASLSAPFSVCPSQEVCSSWELEQLEKLTTHGIKTPDASRFRLPKSKRSGSKGGTDAGLTPASGATVRPTPRFAPSWQSRSHTSNVPTPASQPAARKFRVDGAINTGSRSASVVGRRFHSHAPLLLQNRNHQDPFEGGGDAIEDGSSPIQGPPQTPQTPQRRLDEEDDGSPLVVRESPTATRTKQPAQPLHLPRPGIFSVSAGARRRKQRLELEDEIEDVAPSRSHSGSEGEGAGEGEDNSGESAICAANTTPRSAATSVPPGRPPLAGQKTSAARLLSSIQPLKRRRLFVSPGLITSSPPIAGSDQDDGESGGGGGDVDVDVDVDDGHEARNDGRPSFVPLFKIKTGNKLRHGWDGDDIVDAESSSGSGDDGGRYGNEEIRDIVDYGELFEYADSSDDDGHGHAANKVDNENSDTYEDDAMMDDDHDEDRREDDYDEDMMLDQTPPRIRRARQRQQEKEQEQEQEQQQQQEQKRLHSQRQRLPTFQRARLFMTRKSTDLAGDDADAAEGESLPDGEYTNNGGEHTSDQDLTTPARQQHYYDAVLHQPPPDFFSPQKKRRRKQKRPRHSRHSNDDEMDGLDGLASPSATAAAAITAPEQYVPGGLAASLRDWLLQVKSGGGMHTATSMPTAAGGLGRFVIDETRQMPGMVRLAYSDTPYHEPLRILFCGSDAFSCASLQALYDVMLQQKTDGMAVSPDRPGRIASLDVVVRPAKRSGRGMKQAVDSPVKVLATQLGLPIHERDTFTGWTPPPAASGRGINLVVAVSFGLFVPPRLLRAARFGGLNVHPSLLPDLHGAAPIEHAVLLGRTRTGVTVQTLHETTFDGGRRLLQGPVEGPVEGHDKVNAEHPFGIALPDRVTAADLHERLAPIGAHLLSDVLRRGLYLPERASETPVTYTPPFPPAAAPKLSKADRQVVWRHVPEVSAVSAVNAAQTTSADIDRRARALGALWTHLETRPSSSNAPGGQRKRAILDNMGLVSCPTALREALRTALVADQGGEWPGDGVKALTFVQDAAGQQEQQQHQQQQQQQRVTLPFVVDGTSIVVPVGVDRTDLDNGHACLRIGSIKIEGYGTKPAARAVGAFSRTTAFAKDISWDVALRG